MPLTNCFVISFQAFDINYINFERTAKIQEQKSILYITAYCILPLTIVYGALLDNNNWNTDIIWELPQFINLRYEILTGPEGAFLMMLEASFEAKLILSDSSMTVNATDS